MGKKSLWYIRLLCGAALAFGLAFGSYAASTDDSSTSSMEQQILNAKNKGDHDALAALYENEGKALQTQAATHKEMAEAYSKVAHLEQKHDLVNHCNKLATKYEEAAKEDFELATLHRNIASKLNSDHKSSF